MFQVEFKGLSGQIEFKEGKRIRFKLDLLKLKQHALVKVGEWHPGLGVNITDRNAFFDHGSMNVTLVVTTILVSFAEKLKILICIIIFLYILKVPFKMGTSQLITIFWKYHFYQ